MCQSDRSKIGKVPANRKKARLMLLQEQAYRDTEMRFAIFRPKRLGFSEP